MRTSPSNRDESHVLVFGNGTFPGLRRLTPFLAGSALNICCDGAADKALKLGIIPDLVIGDLDSVSAAGKKKSRSVVPVGNQDSTDLEKALAWLDRKGMGRRRTVLAGFTGDRADFTLYNLHLLKRFADRDLLMIDDRFSIFPARPRTALSGLKKGTLISLMPLSRTTDVTTTGLKWNLKNATLEPGGIESVSNRSVSGSVSLRFKKGFLLWFVSVDGILPHSSLKNREARGPLWG